MSLNPDHQVFSAQAHAVAGHRAEAEEIRGYILSMVVELAAMADRIDDTRLADNLRLVAWPGGPRILMSRRR